MDDCLFCAIVAKKIPSHVVFEDDVVMAFLDIKPNTIGHTLVIPKVHYKDIFDTPEEVESCVMRGAQKVAIGLRNSLNIEGCNIIQNSGSVAGQIVFHMHVHVIPRKFDDQFPHWPRTSYQHDEEAQRIAKTIQQAINIHNS